MCASERWESRDTAPWRDRAAATPAQKIPQSRDEFPNIPAPAVFSQPAALARLKFAFYWLPKGTISYKCIYVLTGTQKCSCSHHVRLRQCRTVGINKFNHEISCPSRTTSEAGSSGCDFGQEHVTEHHRRAGNSFIPNSPLAGLMEPETGSCLWATHRLEPF